jgi:hypothetical protein
MNITFLGVQDALIALTTVIGISVLFVAGILGASALVRRDKARNARHSIFAPVPATPVPAHIAEHPTQLDRVPELVSR